MSHLNTEVSLSKNITLKFIGFMTSYPQVNVANDSVIFDTIKKFRDEFPTVMAIHLGNKFIGYDFLLDKKFSDYEEFNQETVVLHCQSYLNYRVKTKDIRYPIIYQKENKTWPPSDNWYENEPINLGEFLIWNGYGNGPIEVPKEEDNSYHNLIVLGYDNIKKTVNKHSYIKSVLMNNNRDPLTNNTLDYSTLLKLSEVLYLKQPNDKVLKDIMLSFNSNM